MKKYKFTKQELKEARKCRNAISNRGTDEECKPVIFVIEGNVTIFQKNLMTNADLPQDYLIFAKRGTRITIKDSKNLIEEHDV